MPLLVAMVFGLDPSLGMLLVPPIAFISGFGWSCFGIMIAGLLKSIDNFNYVTSTVITPTFLVEEFGVPSSRVPETVDIQNPIVVLGRRFTCPPACGVAVEVDAHDGERAVHAPGAHVDEAELLRRVRERLAGYKVPKAIVTVDELPKTSTGKIQKNVVRDQHASHYRA